MWVDTVAVSVPSGFGAAGGPAARLRLIAGVVMIAAINSAPLAVLPQLAARGACESYCGYCSLLLPVAVQPAAARSAKQERAVTSSSESPARESHLRWKTGHYCCYCCYCYLLRLIEACCCATGVCTVAGPQSPVPSKGRRTLRSCRGRGRARRPHARPNAAPTHPVAGWRRRRSSRGS